MCEGQEVKPAQSRCSRTENWFCSFLCLVQQVGDDSQLSRRPAAVNHRYHRRRSARRSIESKLLFLHFLLISNNMKCLKTSAGPHLPHLSQELKPRPFLFTSSTLFDQTFV